MRTKIVPIVKFYHFNILAGTLFVPLAAPGCLPG
jgi:hypothetical protein